MPMNPEGELTVLLGGTPAGILRRDRRGALAFTYDDDYMGAPDATPLSLSLPFTTRPYGHGPTECWISSLLPDNPSTISRWYRTSTVSTAFGLLATSAGHDCAGAVQFCVRGTESALAERSSGITMLSDEEIATEVERMVVDPSGWIDDSLEPYFSLGGYQTKIALQRVGGIWGRPFGKTPTTHIIKTRPVDTQSVAVVEHLCAAAARRLGLDAANTAIEIHAGYPVLVVERYDRSLTSGGWIRRHQEDMCQALGIDGGRKYEADGGPGITAISDVIRNYSADPVVDTRRFAEGLLWALLLINRDAHARNYSLLLTGNEVRLAPLYDLQSSLPYVARGIGERELSMRYGSDFSVYSAGSDHALLDLAARLMLRPEWLLDSAEDLSTRVSAAVADEIDALPSVAQRLNDIDKFQKRLTRRVVDMERTIAANHRRLRPTSATLPPRLPPLGG